MEGKPIKLVFYFLLFLLFPITFYTHLDVMDTHPFYSCFCKHFFFNSERLVPCFNCFLSLFHTHLDVVDTHPLVLVFVNIFLKILQFTLLHPHLDVMIHTLLAIFFLNTDKTFDKLTHQLFTTDAKRHPYFTHRYTTPGQLIS